jgi:type I restriction enzyme, S subunit
MKWPAYPKYKPSGVEWLGDVPEHWEVKRGRFCMNVNPLSDKLRQLTLNDDISFVPMDNVGENGGLRLDIVKPLSEIGSSYTEFQDGDVVVAKITPCFENGKGAIAAGLTNGVALGTTELNVLRPKSNLEKHFLFYLTLSSIYRRTGEAEMYGAGGQKRVPPEFCKNFPTPLPPFAEQDTIAAFLDRETSRIDRLIEKKRELIERLKEKRTALISRTVTRGLPPAAARAAGLPENPPLKPSGVEWLGDIPKHWEVKRIKQLGSIRYGLGEPPEYADDGIPFIRATDIKRGKIDLNAVKKVSYDDIPWSRRPQLNHNEILVVRSGAYTGDSAIISQEVAGFIAGYDMVLTVHKAHSPFVAWVLLSKYMLQGQIYLERLRAAQPHLNAEELGGFTILIPPQPEQLAITAFLDAETAKFDLLMAKVEIAIERLQEYRTALITAAVTGKIDVRKEVA